MISVTADTGGSGTNDAAAWDFVVEVGGSGVMDTSVVDSKTGEVEVGISGIMDTSGIGILFGVVDNRAGACGTCEVGI